jgi:hypothetical protein
MLGILAGQELRFDLRLLTRRAAALSQSRVACSKSLQPTASAIRSETCLQTSCLVFMSQK